jgi:hypothetical protein
MQNRPALSRDWQIPDPLAPRPEKVGVLRVPRFFDKILAGRVRTGQATTLRGERKCFGECKLEYLVLLAPRSGSALAGPVEADNFQVAKAQYRTS